MMKQEQRRWQETKAKIVSGTAGSLLTAFAVHPLEVVKVRTQAQRTPVASPCASPHCIILNNGLGDCMLPKSTVAAHGDCVIPCTCPETTVGVRRGTFATLRHILFNEGVGSLYAGLRPTLTMGVPNTIFYFLTYDEISRTMTKRNLDNQWTPALAGAAARSIASFSTAPLELIRTVQASRSNGGGNTSMMAEFQHIVRNEGVVGLYRGLTPSLLRDVPFSSIYWMSIEYCRNRWKHYDQGRSLSAVEHAGRALVNGTLSGMIAAACTTPLDVIKTNQQLQVVVEPQPQEILVTSTSTSTASASSSALREENVVAKRRHANQSATSMEILKRILAEEGLPGLWRGNAARMTKIAPACACMIASYEVGQKLYLSD